MQDCSVYSLCTGIDVMMIYLLWFNFMGVTNRRKKKTQGCSLIKHIGSLHIKPQNSSIIHNDNSSQHHWMLLQNKEKKLNRKKGKPPNKWGGGQESNMGHPTLTRIQRSSWASYLILDLSQQHEPAATTKHHNKPLSSPSVWTRWLTIPGTGKDGRSTSWHKLAKSGI